MTPAREVATLPARRRERPALVEEWSEGGVYAAKLDDGSLVFGRTPAELRARLARFLGEAAS